MLFTTWLRPCSCSWSRPGWPCRRPGPRGSASRCRRLALGGVSGGILAFWMNMFLKMFLGTISTQRLWSQLKDCDLNSNIVISTQRLWSQLKDCVLFGSVCVWQPPSHNPLKFPHPPYSKLPAAFSQSMKNAQATQAKTSLDPARRPV